ncbi:MAG: sodium/proline symporter PutP [Lentisphaerae bacterium]|nr:sodium/proline symporter PutP [Lentisphaerota bacterium]
MVINPTYVMFGVYLLLMISIGCIFVTKIKSTAEYFLGGRGVGAWVTALSAQASDMSGWLLMGLPGAVYMAGLGESWVAIGLAVGTILNWIYIAPRLRIYTEKVNSVTLSTFFENRFREKSGILRTLSAIVILGFFTIYAGSGLVACGKLFNVMFGLKYEIAVLIGMAVVLLYTILGGYLAVCWTDLIQGALMFFAIIIVPVAAYFYIQNNMEPGTLSNAFGDNSLSLIPAGTSGSVALFAIISSAVWGLGYCGQPHILTRFMSIKNAKLLPRSTTIATIWVVISLAAAVVIGFLAKPIFPGLDKNASEEVFIKLIGFLCNPWIGGVLLAAILAAIMSTIDSQLLVSSSALTEDFYKKFFRRSASVKELVWISRISVLLITILATTLALAPNDTIFGIVKFAWGGFGAAFGPVVIMSLYSRKTSSVSAIAGMLAGSIVMLVWYFSGLSVYMYEILPGFVAGLIVMIIVNQIAPQKDESILAEYDEMKNILNGSQE